MEKILFALDINDGWPPVSSEGVWCEKAGNNFRLLSIPFFIQGLAFGDEFEATPDEENNHIFEYKVVKESGHSVVWLMNIENIDLSKYIAEIERFGCKVEVLEQFKIYSIDIPPNINVGKFDEVSKKIENKGAAIAYPTWRHE
jgi:hypothetical protein